MTRARDVADTQDNLGGAVAPVVGGKNVIINGGLDIWQRSTSSTTNGYTTADRWYNGGGSGTTTFARESTIVPTGSTYSMKVTTSTTTNVDMNQAIESLNAIQLAGQKVTISYKAAASASVTVFTRLYFSTSTDVGPTGSWTQITADSGGSATVSTTASFSTISGTYTVPSNAKSLILVTGTTSLANGTSLYMGQIQLERGSAATPFARAGGTIQGELAACQRYYWRLTAAGNISNLLALGRTTTQVDVLIQHPVIMRIPPTALEYGGTTDVSDINVAGYNTTSLSFANASILHASIRANIGQASLAQGKVYEFGAVSGGFYGFSAEL
jgi:hypothetical protein